MDLTFFQGVVLGIALFVSVAMVILLQWLGENEVNLLRKIIRQVGKKKISKDQLEAFTEHRNPFEEEETEKKGKETKDFEKEMEDKNLSRVQSAVLTGIDDILKNSWPNCGTMADILISHVEDLVPKFDSGKTDSPLLRKRLEKVYDRLMNNGKVIFSELAADFAKKYNL